MNTEIQKITTDLATQAAGIRVVDQASADRATGLILLGKDAVRAIKNFFAPLKKAQDEAKRRLLDSEQAELRKVEPIVEALSRQVSDWRAAEERKRREAEAAALRAEEERQRLEREALAKIRAAEEAAERERLRLEREAEDLARREREAREKGDAEALAAVEEKREEIRQEAREVMASVDKATDAAIDEAAKAEATLAPVPVVPMAPKTEGLAMKDCWKFEVVDERAVPREYLKVDEVKIGVVVRGMKGQVQIPGVRIYNEPIMAMVGKRNGTGAAS